MGGASRQENYTNIMDNFSVFVDRIGLLFSPRQMATLGIPLSNIGGAFWESSTGMLLEFCRENPGYHIVTSTRPGRFENKYLPKNSFYMLAEGDNNPDIVLDMCLKKDPNLLLEEMLEEALAINASVDSGHKTK